MSEIYTGYFAKSRFYEKKKLKQISVAQFNPSWYNGVSFPELAPSKELLGDYKYNGISQVVIIRSNNESYTLPD